MLYGADSSWWSFHAQDALKFQGFKVTCVEDVPQKAVLRLRQTGIEGFDPDPACVRTGRNSAYQATHVAIHAGAARILLCGVDMTAERGSHHHGDHPSPLRNTTPGSYREMRACWPGLIPVARERGIEIINCSAGSALSCFPNRSIKEILC